MILAALAAAAILVPDPKLTPGAVDPSATVAKICTPGYTSRPGVRHVTPITKEMVFSLYRVDPASDSFEVDHLVSLELGGSNDFENLWPQSYTSKPYNAHDKDRLENRLHAMVCSHKITLKQAQHMIATDWVGAWRRYVTPQ